jgi:hypothetical protein
MEAVANEAGITAMRSIETAEGIAGEAIAVTEEGAVYVAGAASDAGAEIVGVVVEAEEAPALEAGEAEAEEPKEA